MANLVAIMAHCHLRASEILIGSHSHILMWEGGNVAGLAGVSTRQLPEDGTTAEIHPADVIAAIRRDDDDHFAVTAALCLENTHNLLGGVPLSPAYMQEMRQVVEDVGIMLHVDGAVRVYSDLRCPEPQCSKLLHTLTHDSITSMFFFLSTILSGCGMLLSHNKFRSLT
jgi:threonine aldolase